MGDGGLVRLAGSKGCGLEKHFHRGVPAAKVFSRGAVEILLDGRGSENAGAGGREPARREPAVEKRGGVRSGDPPPGPRLPIASRGGPGRGVMSMGLHMQNTFAGHTLSWKCESAGTRTPNCDWRSARIEVVCRTSPATGGPYVVSKEVAAFCGPPLHTKNGVRSIPLQFRWSPSSSDPFISHYPVLIS
jgi:hypothetical protein